MAQKIVINRCFGGFGLSAEAQEMLDELGLDTLNLAHTMYCLPRNEPRLIKVVEKLGAKANGPCAELKIVEVPNGVEWQIEDYDGMEHVAEKHRIWA